MKKGKITLWWHNIWRNETTSNVALCILSLALVILFWIIVTLVNGLDWGATFSSLMKVSPNPAGVSKQLHFVLGLVGSVIITPFVFAAITLGIRHRAQKVQLGQRRYKSLRDHLVMIGYNAYSGSIIANVLGKEENCNRALVILTTRPPKTIRAELRALLAKEIEQRVIIYAGSPHSAFHIHALNLDRAVAVYMTLDGAEWESMYTRSVSVLPLIAKEAEKNEGMPLPVYMMINDSEAYQISSRLTIPEAYKQHDGKQTIDIHVYNFYENWARLLWSYNGLRGKGGEYVYDRLDYEPLEGTDRYVHLAIVGFNDMGKALLNEAIRMCHYVSHQPLDVSNQTVVTIIDKQAERLERSYRSKYPYIASQVSDIRVEFKQADIEDAAVREEIRKWADDDKQLLTIAVCFASPDHAMQTALSLPEEVYYRYEKGELVHPNRVLVHQAVRISLQDLLDANDVRFAHLKTFGSYYEGATMDLLNDDMATFVNGLYNEHFYDDISRVGEIEHLDWRERMPQWRQQWMALPEKNRRKTRDQIDMYRSVFAYLERQGVAKGKLLTDPDMIEHLAEAEHRRWNAQASLLGYRQARGDEPRMEDVRVHTCIVPYDKLTRVEQLKDHVVVMSALVLREWENAIHA